MYQYKGYGAFAIRGARAGAGSTCSGQLSAPPLGLAADQISRAPPARPHARQVPSARGPAGIFNRLEVNGPRTRVSASGTLELPERTLEHGAFEAFSSSRISETASPPFGGSECAEPEFPILLEFELTGTSDDQQMALAPYDPRKLIPEAIDPGALIPGGMLEKL